MGQLVESSSASNLASIFRASTGLREAAIIRGVGQVGMQQRGEGGSQTSSDKCCVVVGEPAKASTWGSTWEAGEGLGGRLDEEGEGLHLMTGTLVCARVILG